MYVWRDVMYVCVCVCVCERCLNVCTEAVRTYVCNIKTTARAGMAQKTKGRACMYYTRSSYS